MSALPVSQPEHPAPASRDYTPAGNARSPVADWRQRISDLRHDLRNPLGEILGFTEIMLEEARERNLQSYLTGLETIQRAANQMLVEVNHTLTTETRRVSPEALQRLKAAIQEIAESIVSSARTLASAASPEAEASFTEDLQRIGASAGKLIEMAPPALDALAEIDDAAPTVSSRPPMDIASSGSGSPHIGRLSGTVLVVDDQEANRALLSRRLGKRGYSVSLAENGRDALECLRASRFDLVLLDVMMPELDGLQVLREMKADPNLAHVPVLMLSAVDDLDAVVECIALGAEDYLPKPFPAPILQARVEACLARKRMSDQLRKYTGWLFGKTLFSSAVGEMNSFPLSRQERTVLFADIRGFTGWSERHTPEEAVAMLNAYFETAEQIWRDSPVIKTEYTGDEIMCVFPSAQDAVRVGEKLRVEVGRLLQTWELGLGVGVHTGVVIEGLMGGADVKAYRFVGDTVNTARRICSEARQGQLMLSETAFAQAAAITVAEAATEVVMKGKTAATKVWSVARLVEG